MDEMVYKTQQWLNATYGGRNGYNELDLSDDSNIKGRTGWTTIYALTRALQIELGIASPADNFGNGTKAKFKELYPNGIQPAGESATHNIYGIIQGALWCKGYSTGHFPGALGSLDTHFDDSVADAIIELKEDAGLINPNGVVTLNVMKALLSMDYFVIGYGTGGDEGIRLIQQELNRNYENYIGLMPCDGVYGRNTNKALIYALQAEEGLTAPGSGVGTEANGNFGPTTQRLCPTLPDTSNSLSTEKEYKFTKLLQHSLYCNGFGTFGANGSYDAQTEQEVRNFQAFYALPVTGVANLRTWLSLLTSCGDTSRPAKGADCATILTAEKAKTLADNGYEIVGRYLTGYIGGGISKALTDDEISIIFNAGLRFFPIYQTSANGESYFTPERGTADAQAAITAAEGFRIPFQTIIYFAVDFDAMDYQITNTILPYFQKISEYFKNTGHKYRVGIYGARNICSRVAEAGYSVSSFVGDMSTGYSGNLGFKIPQDWAFDQFTTVTIGSGAGQIEIDKDGYSGRDTGVSYRFAKPVTGGAGAGLIYVNRSGKDMPVYAGRKYFSSPGIWGPDGDPIDVIPHNGFFVYKEHSSSEGNTIRCHRVLYTNSNSEPAEGYVYEGGNNFDNSSFVYTDAEYAQIWNSIKPFMDFKCNSTNTALVDATAENILGMMCTEFTLADSTPIFDSPSGDYLDTLAAGTKIGIAGSTCGSSRPYLLYVNRIFNDDTNEWEAFDKFIDLRFDLGNMPNNRLLR